MPLTGEAAAFGTVGPGAKAYFDYVNAKGGVNGRKIEYRYYDDAYNPAQTVQLTRRLVEQDKVFAIFNSVGTANNLAIRDYLNAQKVPQLFAGDGSQSIGRSFAQYPWTMGFLQSYRGEGDVYGKTIVKARPKARIAVLYENTELGLDMLTGLTRAIAGKGPRIVAKQAYEFTGADVSAQIGAPEGVGRRHAHALRDAEVLHQRDHGDAQARLEAAGLHRVRLDRADDHGDRALQRAGADEGRALDRVREEPERPDLGEGQGGRPLPLDHAEVQPEREADRRLQLVRHDRRVDDGRDAAQGGEEPHARRAPEGRAEPRHRREPVPAPRDPPEDLATDYRPMEQVYLYRYDNKQWVKASGILRARG